MRAADPNDNTLSLAPAGKKTGIPLFPPAQVCIKQVYMQTNYGTVSQTIDALRREGYTMDFNVRRECLACSKTNTVLSPEEFEIDAVYRFEGESNPDDEAIVYAISSPRYGVKGTLVNAYGPNADEASAALVQKLQQHHPLPSEARPRPIKRSPHILKLSRDHHFSLLFSWKIRKGLKQGTDPGRIREYVKYFWETDMCAHFREEEEILFAPLNDAFVQRAIDDHRKIREMIGQLQSAIPAEAIAAQLGDLADAVDRHVRYEERELFPHLERELTEAQLEAIGAAMHAVAAPREEYADEFWVKTS